GPSIFENTTRSYSRWKNLGARQRKKTMETAVMTANRALADGLNALKLKYWGEAMQQDLLKMEDQERELISRFSVESARTTCPRPSSRATQARGKPTWRVPWATPAARKASRSYSLRRRRW